MENGISLPSDTTPSLSMKITHCSTKISSLSTEITHCSTKISGLSTEITHCSTKISGLSMKIPSIGTITWPQKKYTEKLSINFSKIPDFIGIFLP